MAQRTTPILWCRRATRGDGDLREDSSEELYPLAAWPTSYIIDRDGKVVEAWIGYDEGEPQAIAALQKTGGELAEAVRRDASAKVAKSASDVAAAAQRLFEAIRAADYGHEWLGTADWKHFPAKEAGYDPDHNRLGWVRWMCAKFKANPVTDVRLGKVFANPGGLPTVHFELKLKDGEVLQGDLPFQWNSAKKQWVGQAGLDWHLRKAK